MRIVIWFLIFGITLCIAGCGVKKVESSSVAIEASKVMQTVKEKADYLMSQAQAFYNSKQYQDAVNIAQYVLNTVDKNSIDAKNLLEKAKAELAKLGQQKLDEMKSKIGLTGK